MKKSKVNFPILIVICMFVYSGYSFYSFEVSEVPKIRSDISLLERKFQEKEQRYKKLKSFSENIENVKTELKELNLQFQAVLEHLPSEFNYSQILRELTMLARNSGIELLSFTPDNEEKGKEGVFYSTRELKVNLRGPYTNLILFFDQLSRLKKIINVVSINIKPEIFESKNLAPLQINTSSEVVLLSYRFSE